MKGSRALFLVAACAAVAVLVAGCKPSPKPAAPVEAKPEAAAQVPAPEAEAKPSTEAPAEAPEGSGEEPSQDEAAAPAAAPEDAAIDRDKLSACYQEVYCAQKKGDMDRILDIYKAHGFDTPQDFTKAWIEAAKDTDWITRIANTVAKKCQ